MLEPPVKKKRRHPRKRGKGVASHVRAGNNTALGISVENISLGGLFVRVGDPLPQGTPLVLEIVPPGTKRAIKVAALVVSSVSLSEASTRGVAPGMGVQFDPMTPEAQRELQDLVASLPEPDPAPLEAKPSGEGLDVNPTQVDLERRAAFDFEVKSLEDWRDPVPLPSQPVRQLTVVPPLPPEEQVEPNSVAAASTPGVGTPALVDEGRHAPETAKLMLQVRGLLFQLGEVQSELSRRTEEVEQLRAEVERLRALSLERS